jgi:ABC-type antimicrobial peptide transport system permease subunit
MGGMSVWLCVRRRIRARWVAWTAVTMLIGLAGGVVLASAAGARRTASAYSRFLVAGHAARVLVSPNNTGSTGYYDALAHIDGVTRVASVQVIGVSPLDDPGRPLVLVAPINGSFGRDVERPKLTSGRLPRPDRTDEVVADVAAARALHIHAGSDLQLLVASTEEELPDPARDPHLTLHVVGIGVTRDSVLPVNALASVPTLLGTSGLLRQFGEKYRAFDGAYVVLDPHASVSSFNTKAQQLSERFPETGDGVFVADEAAQAAKVEHAIRPEAVALGLFGLLTGLVTLIAVGQVLVRQILASSEENHTLRALGMSRVQRFVCALAPAAFVAVCGAAVAVLAAYVASLWMPIGPARLAEPNPGLSFDRLVLCAGFAVIVAGALALAAWPAWRATRAPAAASDEGGGRTTALEEWAARVGAPVTVGVGVGHVASRHRGRHGVPTRTALAGVTVAVAAIVGALTFGLNLSRLVQTPRLYGQTWDITADAQFSVLPDAKLAAQLRAEPGIAGWTYGEHGDITVNRHAVPAIGLNAGPDSMLAPTVLDGRAPTSPDEIALGTKTLDNIRATVGQTVQVDLSGAGDPAGRPRSMRIVGRSVFPFFGRGSFTPAGLGVGAQLVTTNAGALNPGAPPGFNFVLIRVAPGPQHDRDVQRITQDLVTTDVCGVDNQCQVTTAARPVDVLNYARVQTTPVALAAVLAVLGVLVLVYLLMTSLRRHRKGFAVLKTIGFTRRQIAGTVAVHATTLVAVALLIGVPAGVVLGRVAWSIFADNSGIPAGTATPAAVILLTVLAALFVANAAAAVPALAAARLRPAPLLRTD